jgi:dTDP-4-dehydrorhamnose reductase
MKILVTGATGFIGAAVARKLSQQRRSWAERPTCEVTVHAVAGMWFDRPKSTKEKTTTTRTPKVLAVKTCPDKAGQPS